MTNYSFQSVGPIFIIAGATTYNILNVGYTVIDMDLLNNEQLLLVKKGLQYNYLTSPDSVDALAYITTNAVEPGAVSAEQVQDIVGTMVVGQNGADATYSDIDNQVVIEVPGLDDKVDKVTGYGLSQNDYTDEIADLVEVKTRVFNDTMSGVIGTGGDLTLTGGITFSVSAGYGYAKDPLDNTILIEWTDPITGSAVANGDNFIYINYLGQIVQQSTRDSANHIYVGYIRTGFGNTQVVGYSPVKFTIKDHYFHLSQFITTGIGTIVEEGCNLSLQANPNQLKVTLGSGVLWIDLTDKAIADTSTFTKLFESSDYGFIPDTVTTANTINNAYINVRTNDHLTALVPMTTGYYKKDLFFITPEGALYYVYATEEYATEELAIAASIPQVPEQIKHSVARVGAVIIQQGATSVVDIYDIRPMLSKLFQTGTPSSPTTVIDHGDLIGLNDDDHGIYHTDARGDIRYNTKAQITAFLAGKADSVHTHVIADTTGLQTALNGKADTAHTHVIADVTGLQTALNGKEATITATTSADYYRGDKTFATLNKAAVGLGNVINADTTTTANITDSANKRFITDAASTVLGNTSGANTGDETTATIKTKLGIASGVVDGYLTAANFTTFNDKEGAIAAGTTGQYYRGDKTFQTLDKTAVGLGSVVDADTTTTANITDSTNKRFVTNAHLVVIGNTSNTNTGDETQATIKTKLGAATTLVDGYLTATDWTTFNGKQALITAGTTAQYYRGDKTFQTLDKTAVGLANVDNTTDASKPISTLTQTALNAKEPTITAGTTGQYWRGDKSWQTLNSTAVGLGNVDNTSDASKPISTLTQTALNAKEGTITAGTTAQYYRGDKSFQTLNSAAVGLGSVPDVDATNASNISSGTLANARLSANLTEIGDETFVDGEIIQSFGGTLQNASLGVGVTGAVEITNSAGQILFDAPYAKGPLNQKSGFFEDFITYSGTTISQILARSVSGIGAGTSIGPALSSGTDTRNGYIIFTTGTTGSGIAGCATGGLSLINFANIPIGGYEEVGFRFKIPTISNGTQSFQILAGFGDSASGLTPTDGAYVTVGSGTTGFQGNTSSNSTRTNQGSLLATVANTDYVVRVRVSNIAGTLSASYFVDGSQLGTALTTNIPSGAGRDVGISFGISKIAGSTARTVELDWIYHESFKPRTINY